MVDQRSRRSLLGAAAAALGGVAAHAVASAAPITAATGGTVKVGETNTATSPTTFRNTKGGGRALDGWASSTSSSSSSTGLRGRSDAPGGTGVLGTGKGFGVRALANTAGAVAIHGSSTGNEASGVVGDAAYGLTGRGTVTGTAGLGPVGVAGISTVHGGYGAYGSGDYGVYGKGDYNGLSYGVYGTGPYGVVGAGTKTAVSGSSSTTGSTGVYGGGRKFGVQGVASGSSAQAGVTGSGPVGVDGSGTTVGLSGSSTNIAIYGHSSGLGSTAVYGDAAGPGTVGVYGTSGAYGVWGKGTTGVYGEQAAGGSYAGYFHGDVSVAGSFTSDDKHFRIDHPADPANRYLVHACVEAPERLNVYSGTVRLDSRGRATVRLPAYHDALNHEHRYQLTPVGAAAPDLHIASGVQNGRFRIAGGPVGLAVSWMVTGVRRDAWAAKHPLRVQPLKPKGERGTYLHPELHGKPKAARVNALKTPRAPRRRTRTVPATAARAPRAAHSNVPSIRMVVAPVED